MLLTVNCQRKGLCKESFGLLRFSPLAWVGGVLRHQFEEVEEELVKRATSLEILGIMGTQLEMNHKSRKYHDFNFTRRHQNTQSQWNLARNISN